MCREVCGFKGEGKYVVLSVKGSVWYLVCREVCGIKCDGKCVVFRVQGSVWY